MCIATVSDFMPHFMIDFECLVSKKSTVTFKKIPPVRADNSVSG